jgi:ribose-phosphate pyrophosphokinase
VIPYYGYARADRKVLGRESIAAKLTANLITEAGADRVLAMDLHSGQCVGYFDIPVDHIYGGRRAEEGLWGWGWGWGGGAEGLRG